MSPRASFIAFGFLAVGLIAAGAWLPGLSEQQLVAAFCAAGCVVVLTVIGVLFAAHIRSRP